MDTHLFFLCHSVSKFQTYLLLFLQQVSVVGVVADRRGDVSPTDRCHLHTPNDHLRVGQRGL